MTNEQLTAYLQDESYLYSVSYEELKTLVMQYPYSANLRILLLKKSYLDQNKDYERNLQMSATYTTNRKYLYKTIKKLKSFKLAPQNVILGEDYLELTELSNIERLLAEKQVNEAVQNVSNFESLTSDWRLDIDDIPFNEDKIEETLLNYYDDKDDIRDDDVIVDEELRIMAEEEKDYPSLNLVEKLPVTPSNSAVTEKEREEDVKKTKLERKIVNQTNAPIVETTVAKTALDAKPSFTEWLSQFRMTQSQTQNTIAKTVEKKTQIIEHQAVKALIAVEPIRKTSRQSMLELFEAQNEVPDNLFGLADETPRVHFDEDDDDVFSDDETTTYKKKKLRPMHQLAARSLIQDNEIVSETLADLLVGQGNVDKAKEMYRKLILRFPEKSSYFAAKIEKIK